MSEGWVGVGHKTRRDCQAGSLVKGGKHVPKDPEQVRAGRPAGYSRLRQSQRIRQKGL